MFSKFSAPTTARFLNRGNRGLGLLKKAPEVVKPIGTAPSPAPKFNFVKKHNRNLKYSKITDDHVTQFEKILGTGNVITDEDEIAPFNVDFTKKYHGNCQLVLTPSST
jgi:hypothetical protein